MSNEDKAYRYLKQQIINGKYQPGHVLSENQMCIKLNMSRTPVREAFKKLENDGLLERDGQETRVTQVTLAELKENYDLRSMLEVYALKKSFANFDQTRLNDFRLKFEKALNDKDWTSYLELDAQFHQYLTHSNDKSVLQKNLDLLKSQTNRMRYAIRDDQRCMISSVDELLQIIAAIKENNQAKAVAQLNKHVKSVYDWERIYLEQQNLNKEEKNHD